MVVFPLKTMISFIPTGSRRHKQIPLDLPGSGPKSILVDSQAIAIGSWSVDVCIGIVISASKHNGSEHAQAHECCPIAVAIHSMAVSRD